MIAMQQQADTIFLLTNEWGSQKASITDVESIEEWIERTSEGKKWNEKVQQASRMLNEENKKLRADGEPPRVISGGRFGLIRAYFPGTPGPPTPQYYHFTPKEFTEAFVLTRKKHQPKSIETKSGISRKKSRKVDFSFNVVQFVRTDASPDSKATDNFKGLTGLCRGDYQTIAGLDEIKSYLTSE